MAVLKRGRKPYQKTGLYKIWMVGIFSKHNFISRHYGMNTLFDEIRLK